MAETPTVPPIRQWSPEAPHGVPDGDDGARVQLVRQRWSAQDAALANREKVVEENVRMLAGRQWDVWVPHLGQFVDATRYMTDSERRWRQRPTVNVLLYWFLLTHARLTENVPVIGFQPATADRVDQLLAETMDVLFKTLWQGDLGMDDRFTEAAAWLLAAGEVYAETCAEFDGDGDDYQLTGPATLSLGEGEDAITRELSEPVPYDVQGNPLAELVPDEDDYGFAPVDGQPATVREGRPKVLVLSPLEVRSEWGATIPWEEKRWIITVRHLSPAVIEAKYGVAVTGQKALGSTSSGGTLQRLLFGAGNFGSVGNAFTAGDGTNEATEPLVPVYTMWEKESPESPASEESAGGRLLIVTDTHVLHDSVRPYQTAAAGPIRRARFVHVPGRGGAGSTPLEQLVPLQKTYNRGWAQILEHRNRCTNPILVYDQNSGFGDQAENVPGAMVGADFANLTREPAYYLAPPPLSGDVWRIQGMLLDLMTMLGSMQGNQGESPTDNASGELVSQLRFNSDRPLGTAARSLAQLLAGVADDLVAVLPTCWPAEKVITYAGEDSILKTLTVMPELWSGRVNAKPDLQNALGETKEAKDARIFRDWQAGAFGNPVMEGAQKYLELVKYPHLNRAGLNGGPDRATCERFLAEIAQGAPALDIVQQFAPWYNYDVFLETARNHLATPEFLSYDDGIKAEFGQFFTLLTQARAFFMAQQAATIAAPALNAQAAVQGQAQQVLAAHSPTPPDASGDGSGSSPVGPKGGPDATSPGPESGRQAA